MTIIFDGTQGITTPTETANNSVTTPVVKSSANLVFQSNGTTEAMRIDTSQNVGIGLTSFSRKLTVKTADGDGIGIQNAAGTEYRWAVNLDNSFSMVQSGVAERLRVNTSGALILQGGSSSSNGVGVAFPATQSASSDANTLDDYEEGTWTPTDISGAGLSLTLTSAYYRKIGTLVFVSLYINYPSTSNSNNAYIGGLPFTARGGNGYFYLTARNGNLTGGTLRLQVNSDGTDVRPYNGESIPTNSQLSGTYLIASGCYISSN